MRSTQPALVLCALVLLGACGPRIHLRGESTAAHPLRAPGRPAGQVTVTNQDCAYLALDLRACTATAQLLRASAQEVCVEVTLGENAESPWADTSRMALASSTGTSTDARVAVVRNRPDSFSAMEWRTFDNPDGTSRNEQVPVRYRWNFATRQVCFPNDGVVLSDATEWIELRVFPQAEHSFNWGFRWALAP